MVGDIIGRGTPYLKSWFILSRIVFLIDAGYLEMNYRCDKSLGKQIYDMPKAQTSILKEELNQLKK